MGFNLAFKGLTEFIFLVNVLGEVSEEYKLYLLSVWPCPAAPVNENLLRGSIRPVQRGVGCGGSLQ
jgi:hypothetical protein